MNPLVIVLPVLTGVAAWLFSRSPASASTDDRAPDDAPDGSNGHAAPRPAPDADDDAEQRDTLPPAPAPRPLPAPSPSPHPAPPAPPEPKTKPSARTPKAAAQALLEYVTAAIAAGRGATLGSKSSPNAIVRDAQADMDNIDVDGVYGPATRARGKALLGKSFPARPSSSSAPAPAPKPAPADPVLSAEPVRLEEPPAPAPKPKPKPPAPAPAPPAPKPPKPKPAPAPQPTPPPKPKAKPRAPATKRSPQAAAEALLEYVTAAIAAGRAATLGNKSSPNAIVRDAQADMGELVADGIYGPASRARGKALLGKPFPARS